MLLRVVRWALIFSIYEGKGIKNYERNKKTSLGLDENIEGALCYVLGWITGLILFLLEKENKFVKFHAMQSLVTFLGLSVISIFFMIMPFIGWVMSPLIGILGFVLWILLIIKAYQGEKYKLPVVGDFAERQTK